MKLSKMREVLAARDIQLTKSLGQNFLHDSNQLRRIIEAAELVPTDKVLEIGPGLGPLTELLVQRAGEVLAIEKDARLVEVLKERFPTRPDGSAPLQLLHDDALDFLRANARDWTDWKLVSNLPYAVASPILVELAQAPLGPSRLVATLQIEVAQRLMATSGDKDYGVLTLLVQLAYEPRGWFRSRPALFPFSGGGFRLRLPGPPGAPAAAARPASVLRPDRQARLFPTAQDDAQAAQGRMAGGGGGPRHCPPGTGGVPRDPRRKGLARTFCSTHRNPGSD